MTEPTMDSAAPVIRSTITFPYKRSLGPVIGAFMTRLRDRQIIGIRTGTGVMCPPLEWDPHTGAELAPEFVEVGPVGTVESWCWVPQPTVQHPLDRPFGFATIRLDGADTALVHAVDAGDPNVMAVGMRVVPRWQVERRGHITDIEAFVPGDVPLEVTAGDSTSTAEPVTMMDYLSSITYTTPITDNVLRFEAASMQGRLLGVRCPECGRIYTGGKGSCPVDSIALTADHDVDLPQHGTVTNFTIISPVQYQGQTETDPFARIHVLLDGADVVLPFQELLEVPNDEVRIGMRVSAIWASEGERSAQGFVSGLVGWMPSGQPDLDDPTLVERIC
jgi:uncharacterized protein